MRLRCGFLIFDGFSNMVLASAIEPLRAARDYAGPETFTWRLLSADGGDVRSSSGMLLRCDGRLEDIGSLDMLFVVAGYGAREHSRSPVLKRLQQCGRQVGTLGALDCGAWLLAAAGLLRGYRATIHWQDLAQFAETHLDVEVTTDRFVLDRNRITAGGATTVVDLMLKLIGDHGGGALAFDVSSMFIYDARLRAPEERGARSLSLATRAPQLLKAVAEMRANIEAPVHLDAVAAATATSSRTLARLFQRELGVGPGEYYQNLRLDVARSLAEETSLGAHEIAERTGFASAASLSRAFSRHFGSTLRETRRNRRGSARA
ncbi:MAG: helix-turn-helix domain-containing protein [Rhizobiaceae bacterium]|nr:helix-turn-helix domain-containing protein [Rhizobiaceae bacterium]